MTITIPRPLAILLFGLLAAGVLGMLIKEAPDLWRYAKLEGM